MEACHNQRMPRAICRKVKESHEVESRVQSRAVLIDRSQRSKFVPFAIALYTVSRGRRDRTVAHLSLNVYCRAKIYSQDPSAGHIASMLRLCA